MLPLNERTPFSLFLAFRCFEFRPYTVGLGLSRAVATVRKAVGLADSCFMSDVLQR